jgi:regulator of protease activity HflC (stomatin/prohibitin superfamily)
MMKAGAVALAVGAPLVLAVALVTSSFVAVPSGHVGIMIWMGQIQPEVCTGVTFFNPLLASVRVVKFVQDTDQLRGLQCVSREGVTIGIPSIEIANSIDPKFVMSVVTQFGFEYDTVLVLNPLGQHMRELCANRTVDEIEITEFALLDDMLKREIQRQVDALNTGIRVNWVRITNVIIPNEIKQKRLDLASEKATKVLVSERGARQDIEQKQKADLQNSENERAMAATRLQAAQIVANAEARASEIVVLAKANAEAKALEAKSLSELYAIPGYVEVAKSNALSQNLKVYFGPNLPNHMFLGSSGTMNLSESQCRA